ncbi:hypothetical protein [Anaeroselena agilis]
MNKRQTEELATLRFMKNAENIVFAVSRHRQAPPGD